METLSSAFFISLPVASYTISLTIYGTVNNDQSNRDLLKMKEVDIPLTYISTELPFTTTSKNSTRSLPRAPTL